METLQQLIDRLGAAGTGVMIAIFILLGLIVFLILAKSFLHICMPNEVLIFSGRSYRGPDGRTRGFMPLIGGRKFKWPIIESVQKMSLALMEVPIAVRNAYSSGGIPMNVEAIANIKISSDPNVIGNAIERFQGQDMADIRRVGKETLEGHLRGVLATLTPEQINEDRLSFAEALQRECEEDLTKLGLHMDTLKIQHVSDEVQYLDATGREMIANIIRSAEIAESDRKREAEQAEAENEGRGQVTQAQAQASIAQMQNELRKIKADLEAEVRSEEERTAAAAREARARAEQELQAFRAELESIRLQVDKVIPAEAQREAEEFRARGEAAVIREKGRAVAEALDLLHGAWQKAGANALQIALIEDIEKILHEAAKGVKRVEIDGLSIIDSGDGKTLSNYIAAYPEMLGQVLAAVKLTTGLDVQKEISGRKEEVTG